MTPPTPQGRGRFPGFDVLSQKDHWDEITRAAVVDRLAPAVPSFFSCAEEATARALVDLLVAQDAEPRIPVLELIDERLLEGDGDGYRYAQLPADGEVWKRSVAALDADADKVHSARFHEIAWRYQRDVIEAVRRTESWYGMPGKLVFELWMRYVLSAFYSHPWSWNEIGFPGPAYPRGYKTLAPDRLEPFEVREADPRDPIPWARKVAQARAVHDPSGDRHDG